MEPARKIRVAGDPIYYGCLAGPPPVTGRLWSGRHDFSIFAVATVFVGSGFGMAYVQKKEVTDLDANTVFYSNLFISFVCYAGLWSTAPAIAAFYEQPQLINLTRVMGGVVIINAFNMIQMAQLTRAIDSSEDSELH